jgi:hypothetical protein
MPVRGSAMVKKYGKVDFEDLFTGDTPSIGAAAYVVGPINFLLRNAFEDVDIEGLDLEIDASEQAKTATLERVWIDGNRPKPGSTVTLKALMRTYRGEEITRSVPLRSRRTPAAASPSWLRTAAGWDRWKRASSSCSRCRRATSRR